MSREVPFDEQAKCDNCGGVGAFDFMGDLLCPVCADAANDDEDCIGCRELWDAQARIEALEKLAAFAGHTGPCAAYMEEGEFPCRCGYDAARAAAGV